MRYKVRYFKPQEFVCNCGCGRGLFNMSAGLIVVLDHLRAALGVPLFISSGFRCEAWNRKVRGVRTSRHLSGWAVDVVLPKEMIFSKFASTCRVFFDRPGWEFRQYQDRGYCHLAIPRNTEGRYWEGGEITI